MIGTGVFTSLGFQVADIQSGFSLLMLWMVGGVIALFGAFVYGEIGTIFPRSGGEYEYLSKIYHPLPGFLSGWVSATVGFSAPVALAAMAFGKYLNHYNDKFSPVVSALLVVTALTLLHAFYVKAGSYFQRWFTYLKIAAISILILAGLFSSKNEISFLPNANSFAECMSPAFAVSLIFVSYAYSGWNAAAYVAGELENPQKNLPRSLLAGTLTVMILYVLLNLIFLKTVPIDVLAGKVEIGFLSAESIFGTVGGAIMGIVISFLLVSTISAMIMAGPRVIASMASDYSLMKILSFRNKNDAPTIAVFFQSLISVFLILTSSFEKVLTFVGFSLNLFTFLTVMGIFILRSRGIVSVHYKTYGYPFTPLVFLALSAWTLFFVMKSSPFESMMGLLNLLIGALFWKVNSIYNKRIVL